MGEKPTLLEKLRKNREEQELLRAELKDNPEVLDEAKKALEAIDKKIAKAKEGMEKLTSERKDAADIIAMLTGGRATRAARAPSGTGKSKLANEFLNELGVGAQVTPKDIAEVSGMIGGAAGAYLARLKSSGYVTQEAPRTPYTIAKLPEVAS